MLGIVFKFEKLKRIVKGVEPYENSRFYTKFADENEIDLFFYSTKMIKGNKAVGFKYSFESNSIQKCLSPIPKVNLVRAILSKKQSSLLRMIERNNHIVFMNLVDRRDKYSIYRYLKCIKSISDAIPDTAKLSYKSLRTYLDKYLKVVIKPSDGAMGQKIYTIERLSDHYLILFTCKGKQCKRNVPLTKLFNFYQTHFTSPQVYVIQPYIPFIEYQGEKFDIRTSVQKDKNGKWKVSGIVTRVARNNGFVTNIAQGGRVVSYKEIHVILPTRMKQKIYDLSLQVAKEIEALNPSTIDLGLDIGIDTQNKLWFIEANYCDQRYAFRESNDLEMWEESYRTPLQYAYHVHSKLVAEQKAATKGKMPCPIIDSRQDSSTTQKNEEDHKRI